MSREKGRRGEEMAAAYLLSLGFEILKRNYTTRGGEIDIIAREGDFLVFVEVKWRRSAAYTVPRESVTPAKQRHIRHAAIRWLQENGLQEANIRFDILEIIGDQAALLRGAFQGE